MGQLRQGIRLKKVDYSRTPAEYELTPYEVSRLIFNRPTDQNIRSDIDFQLIKRRC